MSPATAERIYRLLLRAYPPAFRSEYGREMLLLFRDQCREGNVRTLGFWAAVIGDVARSAPTLRVQAWRENIKTIEVTMKVAAVVTVMIGLLGIVNAMVEWSAGGTGTTAHALALVLAVFASVLLLAAAVALLRPSPRGRQTARLALVASLVLIVAARLLHPWMSIVAQLIGIGLPVALLIALYWPRRVSPAGAA